MTGPYTTSSPILEVAGIATLNDKAWGSGMLANAIPSKGSLPLGQWGKWKEDGWSADSTSQESFEGFA